MAGAVLITGAAGNLGGFLARHLLGSDLELRLMYHRRPIAGDISAGKNIRCFQADLERPETLAEPCRGADCIGHFAGVLFRPRPHRFLPRTTLASLQRPPRVPEFPLADRHLLALRFRRNGQQIHP